MTTTRASAASVWTAPFTRILAATFLYFVTIGVLLPTLPLHVHDRLRGDGIDVGLVIGSFGLAALLARPLAGVIGDRRGRRLLLVSGSLIVALSVAAYATATDVTHLIVMRVFTGIGEALFFVGALAVVSDLAPAPQRGKALTFFTMALYGGLTAGPVIGGLVQAAAGFPYACLIGAMFALASMGIALAVPETRPTLERPSRVRLVHPAALVPGAVLLASVWGLAGFNAFMPVYALSLGIAQSYPVFVLFAVVLLLVRGLFPWIPDRFGPARSASVALALSFAGLVAIASANSVGHVLAATAVFAVGQALAFPALTAMTVARVPPQERSSVLATFSGFLDLGFWLGPVTLGAVVAQRSTAAAFIAAAVAAVVGLAVLAAAEYGRAACRTAH